MLYGIAIGHFVKFGGHFEKAPPGDKLYRLIYHLTNLEVTSVQVNGHISNKFAKK